MADDQDRGRGNEDHFSAEDLEQLYRQGGLDPTVRIRGDTLNKILKHARYDPEAWYVVTQGKVSKL